MEKDWFHPVTSNQLCLLLAKTKLVWIKVALKIMKMKEIDALEVYQTQIFLGTYIGLTPEVFDFIVQEGWIESIEDDQERGLCFADFEFLTLNHTPDDKSGLQRLDQNTIEKFNELDIRIKNQQEYPYYTLDFIDYDEGVVGLGK